MKTKHTPGPWVVRDTDTMCHVIDSPNIGKGYWASLATATQRDPHPREGGGISMATAKANARLIAAAPDLLEALDCAATRLECAGISVPEFRVLIAKARGRA